MRADNRTFKLSRIITLVDIETGAFYNNPSRYFQEKYNNSPIGKIDRSLRDFDSEILILSFVARADGFLRKKERNIMMNYLIERSNLQLDFDKLEERIRSIYCSDKDFRKSLKKLSTEPIEIKKRIYQFASELVDTDKKTHPTEIATLELIKDYFNLDNDSISYQT